MNERRADIQRTALVVAVALVAAAMLLIEVMLTRIFSVLFAYHFSFFAVSLVMFGLSLGGLVASRWNVLAMTTEAANERLTILALLFSTGTAVGLLYLRFSPSIAPYWMPVIDAKSPMPSIGVVTSVALVMLPGLVAGAAFLATAFAKNKEWIGRLYAADLAAAALACLAAVGLLRLIQGLAMLCVPVLLAGAAGMALRPRNRVLQVGCIALVGLGLAGSITGAMDRANLFSTNLGTDERVVLERWNEHSRVVVLRRGSKHFITIDNGAGTYMFPTDQRLPNEPVPAKPWWDRPVSALAYRLGRSLQRTAVVGVGGGTDLLAPLKNGAKHVDGYELNDILLDLLRHDFKHFNSLASWPEVSLIHGEARVGITHAKHKYDVVQASLTDTWAASTNGGIVLAENGLYTVEAWRTFLGALSADGILTVTRWFLPQAVSEVQRLISLAAVTLKDAGILNPRAHIIMAAKGPLVTLLVSKSPFTAAEVTRLRRIASAERISLIVAPGLPTHSPVINRLLDVKLHARAVAESPYDISAPTDLRPYFFLQIRPQDVPKIFSERRELIFEITYSAMQVLVLLCGIAIVLASGVFLLAFFTLPSADATPRGRRVYRWMNLYFLGIGFGYVFIQLGLHQRLILLLGHPTYALSLVLFSMLLGSGIGSALSARLFTRGRFLYAWLAILGILTLLVLLFPAIPCLEAVRSTVGRSALVSGLILVVGCLLGFAFPLGVRLIGTTGEWAVQKGWAVNGAASIAGAAMAAVIGVSLGSRALIVAGLVCYLVVSLCGSVAQRIEESSGTS